MYSSRPAATHSFRELLLIFLIVFFTITHSWPGHAAPTKVSHNPDRATLTATVLAPWGGGNRNPEIIRDGVKPALGSTDSALQYDTFTNSGIDHEEHVGYVFDQVYQFTQVIFQEGKNFGDGGWFTKGQPRVQVRNNGTWTDVPAIDIAVDVPYPNANHQAAFGTHFETYTFTLTGVLGDGLRLLGDAGGRRHFISVGELEVWGEGAGPSVVASHEALEVPEGGTASFGVRLSSAPEDEVTVTVYHTDGDTDIAVNTGASLLFTPSDWATEQTVTLAAADDADGTDGHATLLLESTEAFGRVLTAIEIDDDTSVPIRLSHDLTRATIIATVLNPWGGGNHNPEILRDGLLPTVGSTDSSLQYDTFTNSGVDHEEYLGYTFDKTYPFTQLVFQEGKNFGDGGWFKDGSLRVQVRNAGTWSDVPSMDAVLDVPYPDANHQRAFGAHFETYTFTLTGVVGDGLRIVGEAGGKRHFVSAGEIEVWGIAELGVPPTDLLSTAAHWPLDELMGTTAFDISGNLHDGLLTQGTAWLSTGQLDGCAFFDGSDDRIVVSNPGVDFLDNALSLALWVRPESLLGLQGFLSKDGVFEFEMGRTAIAGQFSLRINGRVVGGSESRIRTGIWQHIGVSWSQESGQITYYYNGTADGTFSYANPLSDNSKNLGIGGRPVYNSHSYHGFLDDIRIYDRILPAADFATLAAGAPQNEVPQAAFSAAPLTGYAPLTVVFDGAASSDADGNLVDHSWDFGDGATDSGAAVSHTYSDGFYEARLRVTDNEGATDWVTLPVRVWTPGSVAVAVSGGSGSGNYAAGSQVEILADPAPTGQIFAGWTGDTSFLDDPTFPFALLTVPSQAATLTATYVADTRPAGWQAFQAKSLAEDGTWRWSNHANWQGGALPRPEDSVEIGEDQSSTLHAVIDSSGNACESLEVTDNIGATGSSLTVRSGDLTVGAQAAGTTTIGKDALGILRLEGGTFHAMGPLLLGEPWKEAQGIVHLTGGALVVEGETRIGSGAVSPDAGQDCQLLVDGGTFTSHGPITVSSQDASKPGLLRLAGNGSLSNTAGGVVVQRGTLEVDGAVASGDLYSLELEGADARLHFTGTGVGVLTVGDIVLGPGAVLDVTRLDIPDGTYRLIDGGTLLNQGLTWAPGTDTSVWSFSVDAVVGDLWVTKSGGGS